MKKVSVVQSVESGIQAAARRFASEVLSLLRSATVQDILTFGGGAVPAPRPKALAPANAKAPPQRKPRVQPPCTAEGCSNRYYPASGKRRLCYEHFLKAGGVHPSKKK